MATSNVDHEKINTEIAAYGSPNIGQKVDRLQKTGKVEERKSSQVDSLVPCDNVTSSNTNRVTSKSDLEASAGRVKLT